MLTSALLREHYSAEVTILRSPDGGVVVAPRPKDRVLSDQGPNP